MTTVKVADDNLLREVISLGHHPSAEAAVAAALDEYHRALKRRQFIELAGRSTTSSITIAAPRNA